MTMPELARSVDAASGVVVVLQDVHGSAGPTITWFDSVTACINSSTQVTFTANVWLARALGKGYIHRTVDEN